jgi:hypothetical protein
MAARMCVDALASVWCLSSAWLVSSYPICDDKVTTRTKRNQSAICTCSVGYAHRNLRRSKYEKNSVFSLGISTRSSKVRTTVKLTCQLARIYFIRSCSRSSVHGPESFFFFVVVVWCQRHMASLVLCRWYYIYSIWCNHARSSWQNQLR